LIWFVACAPGPEALPFGTSADACAECHPDHAEAWAGSAHATSGTSPVFTALLPEVEATWGSRAREACEGCHMPEHGDDVGIGCVSCHAAVGNHGTSDGRLAVDLDAPLSGPLGDAAMPTAAHGSTSRTLLTDATLCGTCHEVTGPALFVETTYTEHLEHNDGNRCVDCHATPIADGPWVDGGAPRRRTDHSFVGLNSPSNLSGMETLLRSSLRLTVEPSEDGGRDAVVTHVGSGHGIPTGVSFLRDLWLEADVDGVPTRLLTLGSTATRHDAPVALLTEADAVTDHRLLPGAGLRAAIPTDAPTTLRLRARAYRSDLLQALDLAALEQTLPTYEIAQVSTP
jgi:hypothetical protein